MLRSQCFRAFLWLGLSLCTTVHSARELDEAGDGEGVSWMYFPDGKGNPRVVFLNSSGPSKRLNHENYISFQLYTIENREEGEAIQVDDVLLLESTKFDPENPTKFVVHGWMSSGQEESMLRIKSAYLDSGEFNVVVVNWGQLSSSAHYFGPAGLTRPVGNYIGRMIEFLVKQGGSSLDLMHIVGHSLGAHVAGFAGASLAPNKIARITGLDPARPGFSPSAGNDEHLDKTDAQFVDIIHTCGGLIGHSEPLGHVDFYPNGGTSPQPGCCCLPPFKSACSHSRANELFAESITSSRGFAAHKCSSWRNFETEGCAKEKESVVYMGDAENSFKSNTNAKGIYYLKTSSAPPYALG